MTDTHYRKRRLLGATAALTVAAGLVAGSLVPAMAEGGSDATPGGNWAGSGNLDVKTMYFDNGAAHPAQGTGDSSISWFLDQSGMSHGGNYDRMWSSCRSALAQADQRARDRGEANPASRVVAMQWAVLNGQSGENANRAAQHFYDQWNSWAAGGYTGLGNDSRGYLSDVGMSESEYISYLGKQALQRASGQGEGNAYNKPYIAVVCVALNNLEPPSTYDLSVSTDKNSTFSLAGTAEPVWDHVHASPSNSSIQENLAAKVTLNWDGQSGSPARQVSKDVTITNNGDTWSPEFTPADFGWGAWPAGKFWFDVQVPKQGKMSAAVDTTDRDPRETWDATPPPPTKVITSGEGAGEDELKDSEVLASGQSYNARITFNSAGWKQATVTDTINTDQVWIGGTDKDDLSAVYALDPDGGKVQVTGTKVDRSGGKTVLSATIPDIPDKYTGKTYTLVVPTFVQPTGTDYKVPDDSKVCYPGDTCLTGNSKVTGKVTPTPDKVWVLDEAGGLKAADPGWTNDKGADGKTFAPGSPISAVVNDQLAASLAENLSSYTITDDWTGAAKFVDFSDASRARVYVDGRDTTSAFDIKTVGTTTVATAKKAFLETTKGQPARNIKLVVSGTFRSDYDTNGELTRLTNGGSVTWNNEGRPTNTPPVFTRTPAPDKAWVLDDKGALATADPDWTNKVGADQKVFLMGDAVSAVVNGKVPANLGAALEAYSIADDWSDAARYVDFSDPAKVRVYAGGKDVTDQFTITVKGSVTTATAKAAFLKGTANLKADKTVKLVLSGAFRTDYDTNGETVKMVNAGTETWNNRTQPTNEPPVFTWTPDPSKDVLGSAEEDGDKTFESIDGLSVFPGQKVEYSIGVDLRVPGNTARGVKSLAVKDTYDAQLTPDTRSIEMWDLRDSGNPKPIPARFYKVTHDAASHTFTVTFTDEWIKDNVTIDGPNSEWSTKGWLTMRFTATVKSDTTPGSAVRNQAFQVVNGVETATEIPTVEVPPVEPDKEDLDTAGNNIDGKTVVAGDTIVYRLTLDASVPKDQLAYKVHKLGMVDDFDEEYLSVDPAQIRVVDKATGKDVTSSFNIQVKDGKMAVFARQVDSVTYDGTQIKGDPQPEDLLAYDAEPIIPGTTPVIDQDLMGHQYWITMPSVVTKETDGYVIKNRAVQNLENVHKATRVVSNPLKDIDPDKDVVASEETKDQSINGTEIALNDTFNYRLVSSTLPADRAYAASQWSITDTFDRVHDQYTGVWAAYANTDLYGPDGKVVYKAGDLLADSAGHEAEDHPDMVDVTFDEDTYTLTARAGKGLLDLVNAHGEAEAGWTIYTKMIRIAPAEKVENTATEVYNSYERTTQTVVTSTPEHPAIEVVKYTLDEGTDAGDRDKASDAYRMSKDELTSGVKVGIRVTNTGDVPLKDVTIADATDEGKAGTLTDLTCASITELAVGQSADCEGTLTGMSEGESHADTVTATGKSVFTSQEVTASDPWHAKAPGGSLARTGASVGGILAGASALLAAGVALLRRRRQD